MAPEGLAIDEDVGRSEHALLDADIDLAPKPVLHRRVAQGLAHRLPFEAEVGGGGWNPARSAKPWVRFCLRGHYIQAHTHLRRTRELARVYADLTDLVKSHRLPERTVMALIQAAFGTKLRNASYRVSAELPKHLASRDLKALVEANLLIPQGERRGRFYEAAPVVADIRERSRLSKKIADPFAEDGPILSADRQENLFPEAE